jgi:hypothetical protein
VIGRPPTALGVAACADPTASGAEEGARYSVLEQVGRQIAWKDGALEAIISGHNILLTSRISREMIRHMGVQHSHYIVQYSVTRW